MRKNNSLIVGGTKGIGKVISSVLEKRGDNIFTVSRNTRKKNNITLDLLSNKEQICKQLEYFFLKNKIIFDNIILCQRYRGKNPLEEFQVSVHSSKYLIDYIVAKNKIKNSIVFISSISTVTIVHDQNIDYHSSRAAINEMSKYYAIKLGPKKITSNCVLPTKIIKPENQKFYNKKGNKITKMMKLITPIKRMGTSKDIAHVVEFLTSKNSTYVTGCEIPVDGGARLQSHETIANIYKKIS